MKNINLIKIFCGLMFCFFQVINASTGISNLEIGEAQYSSSELSISEIDFKDKQGTRLFLEFNCGHKAIRLYDELVNQEVDLDTAFMVAIEFYMYCQY